MRNACRPDVRGHRPRCLVRVAAGPRLGFGHLMRARALASQLDADIEISVRGGEAAQRAAGTFGYRRAAGLPALRHADLLLVDDPNFEQGHKWVAGARRRGVPCISVHDGPRAHDSDLVVCGGLDASAPRTAGRVLRGARFYLLGARVQTVQQSRQRRSVPTVVIALGGGRHVRRSAQPLIHAIRQAVPRAHVMVAPGFSRGPRPQLRGGRWLTRHADLSGALARADVAIVSGGVTLYEACAIGVPAIGLAVVPAQRPAIRAFARRRAVIDAGGLATSDRALRAAALSVARLLADDQFRHSIGRRASHLVDGRGVERVAVRIRALLARRGSSRA